MRDKIITSIDVGTTKFFGIVGFVSENNIEIIGTEVIKTEEGWIKKGRIGDVEGVANGLIDLTESLRKQTGERIEWINIGIGGGHILGKIYSKKIEILPRGRIINENDIQILEREIKNVNILGDENSREILAIIPQEYIIDNNISVEKSPVGMHGDILEMRAHILTGEINPIKDIYECARRAGLKIENLFPFSWAVAESVISEEEKKLGCLIIDMGKSTTDFVFFHGGKIIWTESLEVGSYHIDYDLSTKFHISLDYAEELKKNYAWGDYKKLINTQKEEIKTVELKTPYGKSLGKVSVEEISKIVYIRVREIFEDLIIKGRLLKTGLYPLGLSEIVLTGGGSKLKEIASVAEEIFQRPVKIGIPQKLFNLDTNYQKQEFSAGIGLLLLASKKIKIEKETFFARIKNWFKRWFY
ncbi:MAG: cell division protein FtsA [Candidatus Omnitrophica bacterium]|nr:cell division protein FtsA [Candidatus Omnitrophota bacterium]